MRILCLGDVVGRPGRIALSVGLPRLIERLKPDVVVVNGENASGGVGLDPKSADEIRAAGANVVTLGDHTWQRREIRGAMESRPWIVRPANYPEGAPGSGYTKIKSASGSSVGVFNLLGRVFLNFSLDCPFQVVDKLLEGPLKDCKVIIGDIHAEATSEKIALGRYLDGRVTLLFGTHTHVQTADEQIFAGGTGFISDVGMCGSQNGVIGMHAKVALDRFLTGMPHAYQVAEGMEILHGVWCECDESTGRVSSIERVREVVTVQGTAQAD